MAARSHKAARPESGPVSFGRYLKTIREKQGIPLESVAGAIRVSTRQLRWIEAEDYAHMPGDVFIKGILRAYAKEVGVDPDDIVERYRLHRHAHEEALRRESEILASGRKAFARSMVALAVLAGIIAVSLYSYHQKPAGETAGPAHERTSKPADGGEFNPSAPALQTPAKGPQHPASAGPADGQLQMLSIDAVADVTLNIQIDDQSYTKYRLDPNDHMELAAQRRFHLLISNAHGIRMRFNGRPVELNAQPERSMEITLPQPKGQNHGY